MPAQHNTVEHSTPQQRLAYVSTRLVAGSLAQGTCSVLCYATCHLCLTQHIAYATFEYSSYTPTRPQHKPFPALE
jgi:hypothetical protein